MRPRLLALDLDGTLLPRSKLLSPRARAAVATARGEGLEVVVATGKTWHLAARYAEELGVAGPLIALDGALVRDCPDGAVRSATGIEAARLPAILDSLAHLELLPFLCDAGDRLVVHAELEPLAGGFLDVYASRIDFSPAPLGDADGDPFFLAMLGRPEAIRQGEEVLRPVGRNGLSVFSAEWFERDVGILVVRPRTDKGAALAAVAGEMGIAREAVVAVGDWRNDRGMIQWAGTGVVMADAHPDVLSVADVVLPADSEADGAAAFLEELVSGLR